MKFGSPRYNLRFSVGGCHFGVRRDIDEDTYEPSDRWVMLFSLAVLLLGTGIIYYVFTAPVQLIAGAMFE